LPPLFRSVRLEVQVKDLSSHSIFGLTRSPELFSIFAGRRGLFATLLGMSATLNVLMLSGAIFMLMVYDEVLPSRSVPSLIGLVVLVIIAYAFQAIIEHFRGQVTHQCGVLFEKSLSNRVFAVVLESKLRGTEQRDTPQSTRDLDQLRNFLSGPGPMAILDLPWMFLFLGILFAFHVLLGLVSLAGAVVLIVLTIVTDRMTVANIETTTRSGATRQAYIETCRRNAEVIHALGMNGRSTQGWEDLSNAYVAANDSVSGKLSAMRTFSKSFRMLLQSLILACGAWLVINDRASGGVIIASSILSSRALAPIELAIGNWRGFISARQAWNRLAESLSRQRTMDIRTTLPSPVKELSTENLAAIAPGSQYVLFRDVNFCLSAGDALAIVGPSGSGKSSLARTLVGVLPPARGAVRLDGASLDQWQSDEIGAHMGYLPQDIELFDGTVAQNIARFDFEAQSTEIIKAARDAGVHDLIIHLPDGYDTVIGPNGRNLSAGQRQRIALARALFRDPFLIVLDEPNSNLDSDGDIALNHAIKGTRERGGIVIMVAHRPSALAQIGKLLWLDKGVVRAFGLKEEVLARISGATVEAKPDQIRAAANA
jgi:PrtD family type I secretion system ABC transporter